MFWNWKCSEGGLRELGMFILEKQRFRRSYIDVNTWRVKCKDDSQNRWCPVTRLEAVGIKWNTRGSIWTPVNTSVLWRWLSIVRSCSEVRGGWLFCFDFVVTCLRVLFGFVCFLKFVVVFVVSFCLFVCFP